MEDQLNTCPKKTSLIVISGPSGVGKATISQALLKANPEIKLSLSATTRKARKGEMDGLDYYFISKEQFLEKIKKNQFLEWAMVHGNYYGTPLEAVNSQLVSSHVLLEIDIQGGCRVKELFGKRCITFFILPPSFDELLHRLNKRGSETPSEIERRLETARLELLRQDEYDYTIINDDIDRAVNQILMILKGRLCIEE
ncbi:MAG TPA: guanylate kinase [Caldisericia bacterium]|nr:guanylate kinase [Caldisericia bacterium]